MAPSKNRILYEPAVDRELAILDVLHVNIQKTDIKEEIGSSTKGTFETSISERRDDDFFSEIKENILITKTAGKIGENNTWNP